MNRLIAFPGLRSELQLLPASADRDGSQRWQLFDPIRDQYFVMSDSQRLLLVKLQSGLYTQKDAQSEAFLQQVQELTDFLSKHQLLKPSASTSSDHAAKVQLHECPARRTTLPALFAPQLEDLLRCGVVWAGYED